MKKFVIVSDSCCDLDKDLRGEYEVEYVPMHFTVDGKEYEASLDWNEISAPRFYDMMRNGKRIITSQVNAQDYEKAFERYINEGYDVLSISCSSALSASVKTSYKVKDELKARYPDAKIICIDSLNACWGLGLLCITASILRAEGKTIDETADFIMKNRKFVNQECTVESLNYLKQAGRVSATSAFFGGLLSVKPIIISDVNGQNVALEKVKGRKNSIKRIVEKFKNEYREHPYQNICVVHSDCITEAEELKQEIKKAAPGYKREIQTAYIGPIVGSTTGPGTLAVYFFGSEVTHDSKAKKQS